MAGIAGCLGKENELSHIMETIKYRGPHENRTNVSEGIAVGCLELNLGGNAKKGAHYSSDDGITVVMDGRIYNRPNDDMTDADAVLYFYKKYGYNFASKLHGDFACAISDEDELVLARDSIGVKPLYTGHSKGNLYFASEAKALVGIVDDVQEFPSGYVYSRDIGFKKYSCQAVETPEYENFDQAKKVVAELLREAMEIRMRDNAVGGVLFSGGLDSSLILHMAKEIKPDIEAFTVSMEDGKDLPLAKDLVKFLGVKHHVLMFGEKEIEEILPQAIHHQEMYEESCVHGAIANFLAARWVSPQTRCVLTGEGADEFFAGYDGQYKQGKNPEEVAAICDRLINVAHNTALQRLDRLNAACSMESRTPFLDSKVVDFSMKIPLSSKIHGEDQVGKWVVRKAFEGELPDHIIFQTKRFFAQGSGVAWIMRNMAEKYITEEELKEHNKVEGNPWLSSVEELHYYRMFKKTFSQAIFDKLVGRWDPFRPDFFLR